LSLKAATRIAGILSGILACSLSFSQETQEEEYLNIADDLGQGLELQDVSDRAYEYAGKYWEYVHGHERDDHDHEEHGPETLEYDSHDGIDEELSAGEAVTAIYTHARQLGNVDRLALDIVNVTIAVIDSWPDCHDTFDAVRSAVQLEPSRADEIVAKVAVKRDCNCSNSGIWLDKRVDNRIRVEARHAILDVPVQCSCSQIAMYAGIAGLPENREFNEELSDEEKVAIVKRMTERVQVITDRTAALQSMNRWECGCSDINIASSMQGIYHDELRDGAYEELARKYAEEAADRGLVVDSFGVVGMYPQNYWGGNALVSHDNVLRRKTEIFRGDNLILDPFHPIAEYTAHGDRNLGHLGQHVHTSGNIPTDLFISEYIDGWNEVALEKPPGERDPEQRNRVLELYNGSDETIDLGKDQYFLEIYAGPPIPVKTVPVVTPPALVKKTISLQSDVTFEFDKWDIKTEVSDDLMRVAEVLNEVDLFSEILIVGHTCDIGSDEYNLMLSDRRADSVRDFLQAAGLKGVQIRTEGHGEKEPRLPNTSKANRSRNRRVDITFVTRQDKTIEATISEAGPDTPRKFEYTWALPVPPLVHAFEGEAASSMAPGEYTEGDMNPRQVIGLNGAIEAGETWVIAYDQSDDIIKDLANEITAQLDFRPNETLVIRKLGGESALNCRVQGYSYITTYPPLPFIRYPDPDPPPGPPDDVASPN
jgi:outer membrane protein OmpA-like peptidoglycan-associated protein